MLTFSRKAADELRERIARPARGRGRRRGAPVPAGGAPSAWTFHAWCLALLQAYAEQRGCTQAAQRRRSGWAGSASCCSRALPRARAPPAGPTSLQPALTTARDGAGGRRRCSTAPASGASSPTCCAGWAARRAGPPGSPRRTSSRSTGPCWPSAGEMDYGELVRAALALLEDPEVLAEEVRQRYRAVFVDEYQDTDPAQEELLQRLAGGGATWSASATPTRASTASGAPTSAASSSFPRRFPTVSGADAPVLTLRTSRRAGTVLLAASRAVAARVPAPGLPVAGCAEHRGLRCRRGHHRRRGGGAVVRRPSPTRPPSIADLLRRAHLEDGVPWSEMAVLVRSGRRSLPLLRRALGAAGVPLAAAADELPVARDPAVEPLLWALRGGRPARRPHRGAGAGAADRSAGARRGRRRCGGSGGCCGGRPGGPGGGRGQAGSPALPRPSVGAAAGWRSPSRLGRWALPESEARLLLRLHELLGRARAVLADGGGAEEALWALWEGSGTGPAAAARRPLAAGARGRAADRDLDAVVALFEPSRASRSGVPRAGVTALLAELEAQEIPSRSREEGTLADGDAVRMLTAHRSKGLEWRARRRGRGAGGRLARPAAARLACWRRTGSARTGLRAGDRGRRPCSPRSVGCSTSPSPAPGSGWWSPRSSSRRGGRRAALAVPRRARRRTVPAQPPVARRCCSRCRRWSGGCAGCATEPRSSGGPAGRAAAAGLRAELAADRSTTRSRRRSRGRTRDGWWGLREWTPGAVPVRDPDAPLRASASMVRGVRALPAGVVPGARGPRRHAVERVAGVRARCCTCWPGWSPTGAVEPTPRRCSPGSTRSGPRSASRRPGSGVQEREAAEQALRRLLAAPRGRPAGGRRGGAVRACEVGTTCCCAARWTGSSSTSRAGRWSWTSRPGATAATARPTPPPTCSSGSTSSPSAGRPRGAGPAERTAGGASWSTCGAAPRRAAHDRAAQAAAAPPSRPRRRPRRPRSALAAHRRRGPRRGVPRPAERRLRAVRLPALLPGPGRAAPRCCREPALHPDPGGPLPARPARPPVHARAARRGHRAAGARSSWSPGPGRARRR